MEGDDNQYLYVVRIIIGLYRCEKGTEVIAIRTLLASRYTINVLPQTPPKKLTAFPS